MNVNIIAVGKIKEKFLRDGVAEYLKRLSRWAKVEIIEIDDASSQCEDVAFRAAAMKKEGQAILRRLSGICITLEIDGVNLSSEQLACKLGDIMQTSSTVSFVIGGSYGLDPEVRRRSDFALSFGKNTYPHQLMRLILSEQIYRAFSIRNDTPYHK